MDSDGVAGCSSYDIRRAGLRIPGLAATHTLIVRSDCVDGRRTNAVAGRDTENWRRRRRELIVENALGRGLFSVWWTVFLGDADMRRRLRQAFLGTDPGSFDANEDLQPRAGGQV